MHPSQPGPQDHGGALTRRALLKRGAVSGAALTMPGVAGSLWPVAARAADAPALRGPGSLPFPKLPAGTVNAAMPFDHIVVVMMENHSFDNLLGGLAHAGTPSADGLTFTAAGAPTNTNPGVAGTPAQVTAFPFPSTAQGSSVSQSWNATHQQIDGGLMDGFVKSVGSTQPMGYYPPSVLPFAYSLASSFTVANRWFCSVPGPTYPNRRFLLAGTAFGDITTDTASLKDPSPPSGTIFDRLHTHKISWRNYFTDVPQTVIIPSIIRKYFENLAPIEEFYLACALGRLPSVSFVDPKFGAGGDIGAALAHVNNPVLKKLAGLLKPDGADEEDPQDMYGGEQWAYKVLNAVLRSPAWPRTLLIYTYDEHGGYYDHVPPPAAIAPDPIAPRLTATDVPGAYNIYGPRVPAVVVSPYSRPGATTNVVHDHTSVLATIESKWNLPALTHRDANATTVMDFLDLTRPALLKPPVLKPPAH